MEKAVQNYMNDAPVDIGIEIDTTNSDMTD